MPSKLCLLLFCILLFESELLMADGPTSRTVHVFVALADNEHQGIVPVPPHLGNGSDPAHNLYWGAAGGVKTFFSRSQEWSLLQCAKTESAEVLERCIFKYRTAPVFLVADAYRGDAIRQSILGFLIAAAGDAPESISLSWEAHPVKLSARGGASLVAYVGHDGLMDFQLASTPRAKDGSHRSAIILACASKQYFAGPLRMAGAYPLLWTTGLMAP